MKNVLILYHSKTGITKKYAENIAGYLKDHDISTELHSIQEFRKEHMEKADAVFLGCWTSGLFLFLQHPDNEWVKFASTLPALNAKEVILFTTYKLATGSMFRNMQKSLTGKVNEIMAELKSKNGRLSEIDKIVLDDLI